MFVGARPLRGICVSELWCDGEKENKKFHTGETWRESNCVAKFSESKRAKLMFFHECRSSNAIQNWRAALILKSKTKQTEHTTNHVKTGSPRANFWKLARFRKPEGEKINTANYLGLWGVWSWVPWTEPVAASEFCV